MIKKQLFGVEIEFTGIQRVRAAEIVAKKLNSRASRPARNVYKTQTIIDNKGRSWRIMRDSSISPSRCDGTAAEPDDYRVEFVTPPLNYEDIELLQEIVRAFKIAKATTNSSCGIHIHVDGANHNAKSLKSLMVFMGERQWIVNESLKNEHRSLRWCKTIDAQLVEDVKKARNLTIEKLEKIWYSPSNGGYTGGVNHNHYNPTRYHGLNLHSFFSKGTVEFRLFNSTLHAGKIKAYIQFCLALSAWAITSTGTIT